MNDFQKVFETIYQNNVWTNGSGPGSELGFNKVLINFLDQLIKKEKIKTILDVGCGDFQWFRAVNIGACVYQGIDVSPFVINNNIIRFQNKSLSFEVFDGKFENLPYADLVICKDVLQHLPTSCILDFLQELKKFKVAIIVNDISRHGISVNNEIEIGGYRCIDLSAFPFGFDIKPVLLYGQENEVDKEKNLGKKAVYQLRFQQVKKQITKLKGKNLFMENPENKQNRILRLMSLFTPQDVVAHQKIRIGNQNDGGYVMINNLSDVDLCVSLGVGSDATWDFQMAELGATIIQYDHTVNKPPIAHKNFKFHKTAIGEHVSQQSNTTTIDAVLETYGKTDGKFILKMDIEGFEWNALDAITINNLARFDQIVMEIHNLSILRDLAFLERAERVLTKLCAVGFCCHVHGNNFGSFSSVHGVSFPEVLEVTFVNRAKYTGCKSNTKFPTVYDAPCNKELADLYLGEFRFCES